MAHEKVTIMVLKVDLQCSCCYKKVKKLLCKFPQIRDQVYDEKSNTVRITVVCCNPEKLRDKLCCKGGKTIKSIEIKEPEKPKPGPAKTKPEPEKTKPEPEKTKPEPEKTKPVPEKTKPEPEKTKPEPEKTKPEPEKTKPPAPCVPVLIPVGYPPVYPRGVCCGSCSEGRSGGPCYQGRGVCCGSCYEGRSGGPCYQGHGTPPPPPPCYEGYGRPVYDACGRPCYVSRCDYYFSEDNTSGCTVM